MTGKRLITKDEFDLYVANLNQRLAGMGISPTGSGGGDIEAHNILSATHNDTTMAACVRGDVIIGSAAARWARLAKGAANTFLGSDGTDPSYRTAAQVLASLSGAATATFSWNSQNLSTIGTIGSGAITSTGLVKSIEDQIEHATTPILKWYRTGSAANEGKWDIFPEATTLLLRAVNDAYDAAETALRVIRSGATITSVQILNGYFYIIDMRSGATQGGAGASAGELWKTASHATLPDNVMMIGV